MTKRKPNPAPDSLEILSSADRNGLASLFEAEFGRAPASRASLELMRQNLAWSVQSRSMGEDPRKRRQVLIKALDRQVHGKAGRQSVPYRPGTRLIREWRGTVYEVTVLEKGFAWEGRTFPNLSRIAREITGTRWSGPRFFGLTGGNND